MSRLHNPWPSLRNAVSLHGVSYFRSTQSLINVNSHQDCCNSTQILLCVLYPLLFLAYDWCRARTPMGRFIAWQHGFWHLTSSFFKTLSTRDSSSLVIRCRMSRLPLLHDPLIFILFISKAHISFYPAYLSDVLILPNRATLAHLLCGRFLLGGFIAFLASYVIHTRLTSG